MPNSSNSNSSAARLFEMRSIATAASLFTGAGWWAINNWKLFSRPCRPCQNLWMKAVISGACNFRSSGPWRKTDAKLIVLIWTTLTGAVEPYNGRNEARRSQPLWLTFLASLPSKHPRPALQRQRPYTGHAGHSVARPLPDTFLAAFVRLP